MSRRTYPRIAAFVGKAPLFSIDRILDEVDQSKFTDLAKAFKYLPKSAYESPEKLSNLVLQDSLSNPHDDPYEFTEQFRRELPLQDLVASEKDIKSVVSERIAKILWDEHQSSTRLFEASKQEIISILRGALSDIGNYSEAEEVRALHAREVNDKVEIEIGAITLHLKQDDEACGLCITFPK